MDEILKNKLFNLQTTAPVVAWENIARTLDDIDFDKIISAKVQTHETNPPYYVWENIVSGLSDQKIEKSLSIPRKKPLIVSILKYAVAASIAGIIIFGINGLVNNNNSTTIAINTKVDKVIATEKKTEIVAAEAEKEIQNNAMGITKANTNKVQNNTNSLQQPSRKNQEIQVRNVNSIGDISPTTPSIRTKLNESTIINELSSTIATLNEIDNNRYLQFIGSDGNLIKMPKKLALAMGCVVGPNLSVGISCLEQVNNWREKLVNSPISASADNFMNILNIIKSITDNP